MKTIINFSQFVDGFENRQENFTYEGKQALYDYLEQYEEDTGEEIEFDPIALCCEYTQYENMKELQENYTEIKNMEDLQNNTQVIEIEGSESFIIQNY